MHYSMELPHSARQPEIVTHPSPLPAHLSSSLPCSQQALLVVLVFALAFSNQKCVTQIWGKEIRSGLSLTPAGWSSAHGLLWLYLPAHCALHLLEGKLFGRGIDSSQTGLTKTSIP